MFVVTGITGRVGGKLAKQLLAQNKKVCGVVRNANDVTKLEQQGYEAVVADIGDAAALTEAFRGAEGIFILIPPNFDPSPEFPEVRKIINGLINALNAAQPEKVLCLSTIGAQAEESNLLSQLGLVEKGVQSFANARHIFAPGVVYGKLCLGCSAGKRNWGDSKFLQPLDRLVPMVATADVGQLAAELIQQSWKRTRIVELEGPQRVTPNEIGTTFSELLDRSITVETVLRDTWEDLFRSQGMKNPEPRMRMLDGFNEGWIEFENNEAGSQKGTTTLETVLRELIEKEGN